MSRLIDLSHPLEPGMPAYPGLPVPQFRTWLTHEEAQARGAYAPGTTFQIAVYELGGNTGTYVDPRRAKATVGELAPVWLAGKINLKPTSRARYADVLRTHVLPRWGDIALVRVTPSDIQAWLAGQSLARSRARPAWPSTARPGCT